MYNTNQTRVRTVTCFRTRIKLYFKTIQFWINVDFPNCYTTIKTCTDTLLYDRDELQRTFFIGGAFKYWRVEVRLKVPIESIFRCAYIELRTTSVRFLHFYLLNYGNVATGPFEWHYKPVARNHFIFYTQLRWGFLIFVGDIFSSSSFFFFWPHALFDYPPRSIRPSDIPLCDAGAITARDNWSRHE